MPTSAMRNVWYLTLLSVLALTAPVLAGQKTVMIVYSYDQELAWTKQCDQGIRGALPEDVRIERVFMDTKRIPQDQFAARVASVLETFRRLQPDLVMLSDDNALRLVGPEIAGTGVPVVYLGINGNPRDYFASLPENVIGVLERIPLFHWVRILFEIMPGAESLLVLMDDSPTSEAIIKSAFAGRRIVLFSGKRIWWETTGSWERWQRNVLETRAQVILMPIYHALKDATGAHIPFDQVVSWTSANSRVPVFATQDYAVGDDGVVGALVIFGEEHGRLAGALAREILNGRPIRDLSTADDQQGALFFNRRQLERFGLVLPQRIREKAVFQ